MSISDEQFEYQFSLSQTFKKFYFNPIPKRQCNSFGEGRRSVLVINQEREEKGGGEEEREKKKGQRGRIEDEYEFQGEEVRDRKIAAMGKWEMKD